MAETPGLWRKASYSIAMGECAEVGGAAGVIAVRDTADREGPRLEYGGEAWAAFTLRVKRSAGQCVTGGARPC